MTMMTGFQRVEQICKNDPFAYIYICIFLLLICYIKFFYSRLLISQIKTDIYINKEVEGQLLRRPHVRMEN